MKKLLYTILLTSTICFGQCPVPSNVTYAPVVLTDSLGKQYQDCCHAIISLIGTPASTLYTVQLTNSFTKEVTTFTSTTNAVKITILPQTNYTSKSGYLCNGVTVWSVESQMGVGASVNNSPCTSTVDATKFGFPVTTTGSATLNIPSYIGQSVDITYTNLRTNIKTTVTVPQGLNTYILVGLTSGTWYSYKMQVKCSNGIYGAYSGIGTFRTK